MRALFLVSDRGWSARARAFVTAARGLAQRGHDVLLACASDCPVQVSAVASELSVVPLRPDATVAGDTWQLRKALAERPVDAVFVHTDEEHMVASSALRFAGAGGAVIRRVPPFTVAAPRAVGRFATKMAPAGLLFTTQADLDAADLKSYRVPPAVVPLGLDPTEHDAVAPASRVELGAPANARHVVCVDDGQNRPAVLTALRVVGRLAQRFPALHLTIIGAGPQDELRMHGAALGINSRVTFAGARESELAVIRSADVGWIAADADAAAFAALDFMAARTPVIAPRSPLSEHYVADGIAGVLLPAADISTVAGTVAAFLTQDTQRLAMGNAGRSRLEREFGFTAMIDGYERAVAAIERSAQPA